MLNKVNRNQVDRCSSQIKVLHKNKKFATHWKWDREFAHSSVQKPSAWSKDGPAHTP